MIPNPEARLFDQVREVRYHHPSSDLLNPAFSMLIQIFGKLSATSAVGTEQHSVEAACADSLLRTNTVSIQMK